MNERLFFPRPGKIHSNICSKLTMYLNERFSSLSIREKMTAKEENGHLVGYYITHYTASHTTCLLKWPPNNHEQPCLRTCKVCLVVNHPEIALTLEKCLIQGKNHCLLYLNWALFYELCDFSWYLQVITSRFYKSGQK